MKLKDFKGVFKINKLIFLKKEHVVGDVYLFEFKSNRKINWLAGQHGFFWFWKQYRIFTIASAPSENKIVIATRISSSFFKTKLMNLKKGDFIMMMGPIGWFYIDDYETANAFIASGIGITPIRSMLKENKYKNSEVFFIDYREEFPFKDDLIDIKIHFFDNNDNFNQEIAFFQKKNPTANYFVSGPPKMIKQVQKKLITIGINKNKITYDPFYGYRQIDK